MKQIMYVGFVVNINKCSYLHFAQVRIPALHGVPLSDGELMFNDALSSGFKESCNYNVTQSNGNLTIDSELPWYPICYPFGSTIGPSVGDVVFVCLESLDSTNGIILGWTGSQMALQNDKKQTFINLFNTALTAISPFINPQ